MDHSWGYGSEQRLRNENQDCFGLFEFPDFTLAVVCDGMGGHVGGAQASTLAVKTVHDHLRSAEGVPIQEALAEALQKSNQAIYEAARKNHRLMGMGTTSVVAAITDDTLYLAHVGDSRAYLVRNGQVSQITRDHTMVNLFVDAELLTPEDAATHPEAHVLSRSLGVERQVDVEVGEATPLEPDDVVFLCSDGVHGVVTDWELGNVDWGAPNEGVRHVLDIVIGREGDDNATAVGVRLGTSFEDVPPTPVPEPLSVDEVSLAPSGITAVPFEDQGDEVSEQVAPVPAPLQPGGPTLSAPDDEVPAESPPDLRQQKKVRQKQQQQHEKKSPAPREVAKSRRPLVLVAVAALTILGLGIGVIGLVASSGGGGDEPQEAAALAPPAGGDVEVAAVDPLIAEPAPALPAEPQPEAEDSDPPPMLLFAPELPPPPRRLPHRAIRYTQPPPGGPLQWEAVQSARNKDCAESLDAVRRGMVVSIDHATLYTQAWFCFNESRQRPLEEARIDSQREFYYQLPNFEGEPKDRAEQLDPSDPEGKKTMAHLPAWYRPAVDGIEYRLEAWENSDDEDLMAEVMTDQFGDPTVADHLAKDILLEVAAAEGLSRFDERSEDIIEWWARRVYVVSRAMSGKIGRQLELHRPDLVPRILETLDRATQPYETKSGRTVPVPEVVLRARRVGEGEEPPPTVKAKTKVKVKPITEPSLEDLTDGKPVIHRGKR